MDIFKTPALWLKALRVALHASLSAQSFPFTPECACNVLIDYAAAACYSAQWMKGLEFACLPDHVLNQ